MSFWTMLMVKVPSDRVDDAAEAFIKRRIIEECSEVIPGFLHGELIKSQDPQGQLCVLCAWTDKAAYEQWVASPVRAKQNVDAAGFTIDAGFSGEDVHTLMFDSVHSVSRS